MKLRVIVLGAGFGGLEISTLLSEKLGEQLDLVLIDKNNSFYFGFSKLDVMFGRTLPEATLHPYSQINKKGVRFVQAAVTGIDPVNHIVTTSQGSFVGDVLIVAMGADYDLNATPGLKTEGNEFYSMDGAIQLRELIPTFTSGHAIVGVTSAPFKCPPAPSEAALLLHDYLVNRGLRNQCSISLIIPFGVPIPPSPDSSKILMQSFEERGIQFIPNRKVVELMAGKKTVILDDGTELPFDLFLGIPKHVAPKVVLESGLAENGWIPVNKTNLQTKFPGVYAVGDVTSVGTPKAGVFAEGAAKAAAAAIVSSFRGEENKSLYNGAGSCYLEFGEGKVARVDVDFFSGPKPVGVHQGASEEMIQDKEHFGASRVERWFKS